MHEILSPLLAVFECPLDARFRKDVSSFHTPNIPPVRAFYLKIICFIAKLFLFIIFQGKKSGKVFIEYFHCSPFNAQFSFSAKVPELSPLKSSNSFATDALLYILDGHSNRLSDIKAINLKYNKEIVCCN